MNAQTHTPTAACTAALNYAACGWHVFPVPPGEKKSHKSAEHSGGRKWGATADPSEIQRDFARWPRANVGIVTGPKSGFFVVECDTPEGHNVDGIANMVALLEKHGELPETIEAMSPSGSWHLYFKWPDGGGIQNSASQVAPGVDVRADGGMVIAPPSVRPGYEKCYRWKNPPDQFTLAECPDWLLALCRKPAKRAMGGGGGDQWAEAALREELGNILSAAEGERNDTLNTAAFNLAQIVAGGHLDGNDVRARLARAASTAGLSDDEVEQTIESAFTAGMQKPRNPTKKQSAGEVSEHRIALAFTEKHGDRMRFDHNAGKWYEWAGSRWRRNDTKVAFHYARQLAVKLSSGDASFSRSSVANGAEAFARADPAHAVTADVWDCAPYLIGTPGGTVNLKTGDVYAPRQADMITKQTGVTPEHGAPSLWLDFLDQATAGDKDLIRFLQQVAGYCLSGITNEHALFFIYGPGGNGKSVFLNTLNHILGDYATTASMDTFTASKSDRHPTDLAMLNGARLVSASETEEGRAWAESRIKQLTGGDKISARFMRQDFFEFVPAFKLVIVGNHAPVLANVDDAARRRFNIIPFTHKPARPDRQLEDKLKQEAGRILGWAIDGCMDWQDNGLVRPEIVTTATADYFDDQDLFGQWIKDRCELATGKWEMPTPLYNDWADYAKAAGDDPGTLRAMGSKLKRAGFQPRKVTGGVRTYQGLALKPKRTFSE